VKKGGTRETANRSGSCSIIGIMALGNEKERTINRARGIITVDGITCNAGFETCSPLDLKAFI